MITAKKIFPPKISESRLLSTDIKGFYKATKNNWNASIEKDKEMNGTEETARNKSFSLS